MHRGRGACGRSGKIGEIPGKPGKCGSVGAKEVACDKEVGLHASGISCATRNPTRFGDQEVLGAMGKRKFGRTVVLEATKQRVEV